MTTITDNQDNALMTIFDNGATAMGSGTTATGNDATAMGLNTTASDRSATAMGFVTTAATHRSLSIGECNDANTSADNTLFAVGNGDRTDVTSTSCDNNSDAFTVDEAGNATASSHDTFSDRRLKTAIEPLGEGILQKLANIRPVQFRFKNEATHPSGKQIGLIAQDVRKGFPALVREGSGGYLSLAYPKLTAVLLKGLQEQQAQLDRQQKQIRDLKAENEEIKERLAALEETVSADEPAVASLAGPWSLAIVLALGLSGLIGALLWRRRW